MQKVCLNIAAINRFIFDVRNQFVQLADAVYSIFHYRLAIPTKTHKIANTFNQVTAIVQNITRSLTSFFVIQVLLARFGVLDQNVLIAWRLLQWLGEQNVRLRNGLRYGIQTATSGFFTRMADGIADVEERIIMSGR